MACADHIVGKAIARAKKAGLATPNCALAYAHMAGLSREACTQSGLNAGRGEGLNSSHELFRPLLCASRD